MTAQQEKELADLNNKISDILPKLVTAKNLAEYDKLYDEFIIAHDRREVLSAIIEMEQVEMEDAGIGV